MRLNHLDGQGKTSKAGTNIGKPDQNWTDHSNFWFMVNHRDTSK